jgi:Fe-S oxidoreductase/nitrate reductase gamma subunit
MSELSEATRPLLWNISSLWIMYALFLIAFGVFCWGIYTRIRSWRKGKSDDERLADWGKRLWLLIKELALQQRTRDSWLPGLFHSLIFYSFVVLVFTTAIVGLDADFGTTLFRGYFYVALTVGAELAGILVLLGVTIAIIRRTVKRPKTLENGIGDIWPLLLIAAIIITGFLIEGLRIAARGDDWSYLSPVGQGAGRLFNGLSEQTLASVHKVTWWTHTALSMAWIASIPYTKFVHLIALPSNVFFTKLKPRGEFSRVNLAELMESDDFDDDTFSVGVETAEDFTWKQRLDFDACISCGRCEESCPAYDIGNSFSPKQFIVSCRDFLEKKIANAGAASEEEGPTVVGDGLDEEFVWYCRTCAACMEVCPACIDHVDTLMEVRRNQVLIQGNLPDEAARALRTMDTTGNPFGHQDDRMEWMKDLDIRVVGPGEKCDVIFWAGCFTSFDPTKQQIAKDVCKLLTQCEIDFGVLGKDEICCGDPARIIGDERVFQEVVDNQVELLNKREFRVLVTSCPHCYNTLKNEHPQFGGNYNVVHYTEFLHELLLSGKLEPKVAVTRRITYHDPCYLGRYSDIYDAPRKVIAKAANSRISEMKDSRRRSMCCGGGGGHFWMDLKSDKRINNMRIQQAIEAKADTVVTSCAYCKQMLEDAVKALDLDERLEVVDIASLVVSTQPAEKKIDTRAEPGGIETGSDPGDGGDRVPVVGD